MLRGMIKKAISEKQKLALKSKYNKVRIAVINTFLSYNSDMLKKKLREMEIHETDTLLVHANFNPDSGFRGSPLDIVNALTDAVGTKGNLLMVSIPFRGSSYDYLVKYKPFHYKKTISMMGLVTEMFRRKEGVLRSLHPTHPVLACGKDSEWLIEGHEKCLYPCGVGSPFDKFRQLKGKILFFDVGFEAITFFHYIEDITKDMLPFPVYCEKPFHVKVYDKDNEEHMIETYAFNKNITRAAYKVEREMERCNKIKTGKIGNSRLILVNAEDVVTCQTTMIKLKNFPYDFKAVEERN